MGGPFLNITDLANLLVRAGAVRAMELDINTDWVNFATYAPTTPTGLASPANGTDLLPPADMAGPPTRYFVSLVGPRLHHDVGSLKSGRRWVRRRCVRSAQPGRAPVRQSTRAKGSMGERTALTTATAATGHGSKMLYASVQTTSQLCFATGAPGVRTSSGLHRNPQLRLGRNAQA